MGQPDGKDDMKGIRILAILLIVSGTLGLVYGAFTYTRETHEAKIGSLEIALKEKKTVQVPVWASVGAIAAGAVLLLVKRSS
jgi:hypothetical protein